MDRNGMQLLPFVQIRTVLNRNIDTRIKSNRLEINKLKV